MDPPFCQHMLGLPALSSFRTGLLPVPTGSFSAPEPSASAQHAFGLITAAGTGVIVGVSVIVDVSVIVCVAVCVGMGVVVIEKFIVGVTVGVPSGFQ
jgi:hypothetical protein